MKAIHQINGNSWKALCSTQFKNDFILTIVKHEINTNPKTNILMSENIGQRSLNFSEIFQIIFIVFVRNFGHENVRPRHGAI